MKFLDADVKTPLASVSSTVDQGNRVVSGADASYIENIESGRRIPMFRRRGVFVLEIDALGVLGRLERDKTHWNGSGRGRQDWILRGNRGREGETATAISGQGASSKSGEDDEAVQAGF